MKERDHTCAAAFEQVQLQRSCKRMGIFKRYRRQRSSVPHVRKENLFSRYHELSGAGCCSSCTPAPERLHL